MKAVQFGAGNIGRGFLGQLFSDSGFDTTFIEVVPSVVEALNAKHRYQIHIASDAPSSVSVERVRAVSALDSTAAAAAVAEADIASTAVGVNVLPKIAPTLALGIALRFETHVRPLDIIVCENLINAGPFLREQVRSFLPQKWHDALDQQIGFVEASIGRMVPIVPPTKREEDPLWIAVEAYCELPVDADAFRGPIPPIDHLKPITPFAAYVERKLFIHNQGHATAAYLGYLAGYEFVWQAVEDPSMCDVVRRAMSSAALALSRKHRLNLDELNEHVEDLLHRFGNRALGDQVLRVAADPLRKLSANDRFMGAIRMCLENDVDPTFLAKGAAAALRFDPPSDPSSVKLGEMIALSGIEAVVRQLAEREDVADSVLREAGS